MVKKALNETVMHYLELQKGSKTAKLESDHLSIQEYLKSQSLTVNEKKLIFKLRSNMVIIANNYNGKGKCKLCDIQQKSQTHLLNCIFIKGVNSQVMFNPHLRGVLEDDIYSNNILKVKNAAILFKEALRSSELLHEYLS